jgi:hypothetical protein
MTSAADFRPGVFLGVAAGVVLLLGAVAAIVVWDPIGDLVRAFELPGWVSLAALGKVKFVLIAAFGLAVAVRELRRERGA